MKSVDDKMGRVISGDALDEEYNICILPLIIPCKQGMSQSKRRESQTHGVRAKRCSKCGEVGHYKIIAVICG